MSGEYIAAEYARLLTRYCRENIPEFAPPKGSVLESVDNVFEQIPLEIVAPYIAAILETKTDVPAPWLVGSYFFLNSEDMFAFSLMKSPNVAEANEVALHFYRLITNVVIMELENHPSGGATARIELRGKATPILIFVAEFVIAQSLILFLSAKNFDINSRPDIIRASSFGELIESMNRAITFLDVDYSFGKFVGYLSKDSLDTPNKNAEQRLRNVLVHELESRFAEIPADGSWRERVAVYLKPRLQDQITLDDTCNNFHQSRRTLSRLLASEGTTFKKILNEVRNVRALELIKTDLPLKRVADQSGFNNTSTFTIAFKGWTGESPKVFREQQRKLKT